MSEFIDEDHYYNYIPQVQEGGGKIKYIKERHKIYKNDPNKTFIY